MTPAPGNGSASFNSEEASDIQSEAAVAEAVRAGVGVARCLAAEAAAEGKQDLKPAAALPMTGPAEEADDGRVRRPEDVRALPRQPVGLSADGL